MLLYAKSTRMEVVIMRTNISAKIARPCPKTHEGATASRINPEQALRRSVMACMLFEDEFYEDGITIADRIASLIPLVKPDTVASIAIEAREKMKLRHVPLWLLKHMAGLSTHKHLVAQTLERVIQRPDELTEFLSLYQLGRTGTKKLNKLSKQVQKGLAIAFTKFDEYALQKYNRKTDITLKDVLFLSHAKPKDEMQAEIWKRLISNTLKTPDTWEVELSASIDKKASWERLLRENKLGGLALLRNLRNFQEVSVDENLVFVALEKMKTERILPFRFIAAAKYAPQWESHIEKAMLRCLASVEKLTGKTALVIDGSGSMFGTPISAKSEIDRFEAASALAILLREICNDINIIVFSDDAFIVPSRHGFALRDALISKAQNYGTNTQNAIVGAAQLGYNRIIVITDEQSHQSISAPIAGTKGYFINVASAQNGIGYGAWTHLDGWSEAIIDYIREFEKTDGVD